MNSFLVRVAPWFLIAIGAIVLGYGVKKVMVAAASKGWTPVPGVIEESVVEEKMFKPDMPRQADNKSTSFHANIRYRFSANNKSFTGTRVSFGDHDANYRSYADDLVQRYPKDGEVTVYYNPANPEQSVLEPGVQPQTWVIIIVGVVLLAAGGMWLRSSSKPVSDSSEPAATLPN